MLNYGESLRYWREINGYTQQKLADETGIKQDLIDKYWPAGTGRTSD